MGPSGSEAWNSFKAMKDKNAKSGESWQEDFPCLSYCLVEIILSVAVGGERRIWRVR